MTAIGLIFLLVLSSACKPVSIITSSPYEESSEEKNSYTSGVFSEIDDSSEIKSGETTSQPPATMTGNPTLQPSASITKSPTSIQSTPASESSSSASTSSENSSVLTATPAITDLPQQEDRLYMMGKSSGIYITSLHQPTAITGIPTTERGVWGGNMSRICTTKDGVYTAYMTGGGAGETEIKPFTLFFKPHGSEKWKAVGTGESRGYAVITLAGSDGKVYVSTIGNNGGTSVPAVYSYSPVNKEFVVAYDSNPTLYFAYMAATIDNSGKITMILCGGSKPGGFRYLQFDTNNRKFGSSYDLKIDYRHCYVYLHIKQDGSLEFQAQRDTTYYDLGYPKIEGSSFDYVFDSIRYFKIEDFASKKLAADIIVRRENPEDYQQTLTSYPAVINNYTGDAHWDLDGRLHIFYTVKAKSNNWTTDTWHAIIQDDKLIYNEKIWTGATSLRMVQDSSGNYYLLKMSYGSRILEIYKSNSSDGYEFSRLGQFILPEAGLLQYAGLSIAKAEGGTPASNIVDVIYPSRASGAKHSEEWNYFRVHLK